MDSNDLPIRLAQTIGITTSSVLAGSTLTISMGLIPRLLESPTPLMLRQWAAMFNKGKQMGPPFGSLAAAAYFYLAYTLPSYADKSKLYGYIAAGLLSIGIVPYTLIFLMPTNTKLLKKTEETKALGKSEEVVEVGLGEETAHKLVDWWGVLNLGRGVMLTASGLIGAWTALQA